MKNGKYLLDYPYLNSIGISSQEDIIKKLNLKGKINSHKTDNWSIRTISSNLYSSYELHMIITNGTDKYKIIYTETKKNYNNLNIPNFSIHNSHLVEIFSLCIVNSQVINPDNLSDTVVIPLRLKAS